MVAMSEHLEEHELTAAGAGLELDEAAREHLRTCVACRRQIGALDELIKARRAELQDSAPDWEAQREQILARLPATGHVAPPHRHWTRPLLAAAASLALALGAAVLYLEQRGREPGIGSDRAEEILTEVEATLDSDAVAGFGAFGVALLGSDESQTEDGQSSTWDVAVAVLEDDDSRYQVPGLEALALLIPSLSDLETMVTNDSEAS